MSYITLLNNIALMKVESRCQTAETLERERDSANKAAQIALVPNQVASMRYPLNASWEHTGFECLASMEHGGVVDKALGSQSCDQ